MACVTYERTKKFIWMLSPKFKMIDTSLFITTLLVIAEEWKLAKYLSIQKWLNNYIVHFAMK